MKRKITIKDRYAIQGMLHSGLSEEEILESFEKDYYKKSLLDYLENLDNIHETVAKIQSTTIPQTIYNAVLDKLKKNIKIEHEEAVDKLNKVCEDIKYNGETVDDIYNKVVKTILTKLSMSKKTKNGEGNVTIMTKEASMRTDSRKKSKQLSGNMKGNVFNPSTGEVL